MEPDVCEKVRSFVPPLASGEGRGEALERQLRPMICYQAHVRKRPQKPRRMNARASSSVNARRGEGGALGGDLGAPRPFPTPCLVHLFIWLLILIF